MITAYTANWEMYAEHNSFGAFALLLPLQIFNLWIQISNDFKQNICMCKYFKSVNTRSIFLNPSNTHMITLDCSAAADAAIGVHKKRA